jgi:hypothetical protein
MPIDPEKKSEEEGKRSPSALSRLSIYYPSSRLDRVQESREEEAVKEPLRSCGKNRSNVTFEERRKKKTSTTTRDNILLSRAD